MLEANFMLCVAWNHKLGVKNNNKEDFDNAGLVGRIDYKQQCYYPR
jgi:hypothetical protein